DGDWIAAGECCRRDAVNSVGRKLHAIFLGADVGGELDVITATGKLLSERCGGKEGPASASSSKQNKAATQAACSEKKALENQGARRQQTENCNRTATEVVTSPLPFVPGREPELSGSRSFYRVGNVSLRSFGPSFPNLAPVRLGVGREVI